ncbi:MAG: hypothetical protein R2737_05550 [Candidatus Nanopelagicales bacterium]
MPNTSRPRTAVVLGTATALTAGIIGVVAGVAVAAGSVIPGKEFTTNFACSREGTGVLRMVRADQPCESGEIRVQWPGKPGSGGTGPAGPAGPAGSQGPQGVPGTPGQNGTDGIDGAFIWHWTWTPPVHDPFQTTTTFAAGTYVVPVSPTMSAVGCPNGIIRVRLSSVNGPILTRWDVAGNGSTVTLTSVSPQVAPANGTPLFLDAQCGVTPTNVTVDFTYSTPTPIS